MSPIDDRDIYEQLGRLMEMSESTKIGVDEIRNRVMGLPCGAHVEILRAHEAKLDKILLGEGRHHKPSTGEFRDLRKTAQDAAEEVTDQLRIDATRLAREAAVQAVVDREHQRNEESDRRTKRIGTWLQIIATVLAILGAVGITASVRFMYGAESQMARQAVAVEKQRIILLKHQGPDAGQEP